MVATAAIDGGLDALLDLAAGALPGPGPQDLAEGPETRVTTEIRAAVEALGRDPIAIFNFVHDRFDAEPYYGAKKGSVGAWEERAGNDADLSSLLVAMLRAAGIPARFEYGTVDLTPDQAMAWSGTTEVYQAGDALATGGVPTIVDRSFRRARRQGGARVGPGVGPVQQLPRHPSSREPIHVGAARPDDPACTLPCRGESARKGRVRLCRVLRGGRPSDAAGAVREAAPDVCPRERHSMQDAR